MNYLEKEYKVNEQGMIVEEIENLIDKGLNKKSNPHHGREPFIFSDMYESKMLLDDKNSESKDIHLNHGKLKIGGKLDYGAHGTKEEPYDEAYIILKGKSLTIEYALSKRL